MAANGEPARGVRDEDDGVEVESRRVLAAPEEHHCAADSEQARGVRVQSLEPPQLVVELRARCRVAVGEVEAADQHALDGGGPAREHEVERERPFHHGALEAALGPGGDGRGLAGAGDGGGHVLAGRQDAGLGTLHAHEVREAHGVQEALLPDVEVGALTAFASAGLVGRPRRSQ